MQITVKQVEDKKSKDGTKSFQKITDLNDNWYSLWEPNLFGTLEVGKTYEIAIEVKGTFKNINEVKIVPGVATVQPNGKPTDKDTIIAREVCLKAAVEQACALTAQGKEFTSEQVVKTAQRYEKYVTTGE